MILDKIAFIFDGQSTQEVHYVGVFASFSANDVQGLSTVCLALFPLDDMTMQDADEHITFMEYVLVLFGKWLDNLVASILDNCSTNQVILNKTKRSLISRFSHRI